MYFSSWAASPSATGPIKIQIPQRVRNLSNAKIHKKMFSASSAVPQADWPPVDVFMQTEMKYVSCLIKKKAYA